MAKTVADFLLQRLSEPEGLTPSRGIMTNGWDQSGVSGSHRGGRSNGLQLRFFDEPAAVGGDDIRRRNHARAVMDWQKA